MPIPLLLVGAGLVAGVVGAGGHLTAKETNEQAAALIAQAKELYEKEKESLDLAQKKAEEALLLLGNSKKTILDSSMQSFLNSYERIKDIRVKYSSGLNEIANFIYNFPNR